MFSVADIFYAIVKRIPIGTIYERQEHELLKGLV